MVNNFETNMPDLKTLKQNLQLLKDQRMDFVVQLGEITHQQLKETDELVIENLKNLSKEILLKDIQIFQTQKSINQLNANNLQCSNCKQSITVNAKFCGNCGTLNPHFVDQNAQYIECSKCQQLIESQNAFCPCCGAKQEANE